VSMTMPLGARNEMMRGAVLVICMRDSMTCVCGGGRRHGLQRPGCQMPSM
jgi:hypothetical protein